MRKPLQFAAICLSLFVTVSSCKSSQESMAQRKADIEQSKDNSAGCFVKMKDGTVKNYSSLKLMTGFMKAPYLLADGKMKINASDIVAYQNKEHYAISQVSFATGRKTYVAKETLPGFAIRIAKGKINVYTKKYYNGTAAVDEYFVQKGDDGMILAYTAETMNLLVKDDVDALNFFVSKKYNTPKSKKDPITSSFVNNDKKLIRNKQR